MQSAVEQGRRASGRLQGSKRPRYAEPGVSDEELDVIDNDEGEEEMVQKLPKLSQQDTPSMSKQQRRKRCVWLLHAGTSCGCQALQTLRLVCDVELTVSSRRHPFGTPCVTSRRDMNLGVWAELCIQEASMHANCPKTFISNACLRLPCHPY